MGRRSETNDGFELLLDTMTNAFGGVLFLAILISLQLQQRTVKQQSSLEAERQSQLEVQRLAQLRESVESLAKQIDRQREVQQEYLMSHGEDLFHQVREREQQSERLKSGLSETHSETQAIEIKIETLRKSHEKLEIAKEHLRKVQHLLAEKTKERTVTGKLPRQRQTLKREVPLVVKYDRLYSLFKGKDDFNTNDFFSDDADDRVLLEPKPYRGQPVTPDGLQNTLSLVSTNPRNDYLAIVIWNDSFDSFLALKREVIRQGFQYRLILASEGDEVVSGYGGSDGVMN